MTEKNIIAILAETGPVPGAQLCERSRVDVFLLWQICRKSKSIRMANAGRRFLRLDRNVQGYARLSPSIRREFLTYTVVGLESQADALNARAEDLTRRTKEISEEKRAVARACTASVLDSLPDKEIILQKACFMLAGDVVYDMSHKVPRPEKSTGEMVQGSDLDIIIVADDDLDPRILDALDRSVHKRKHLLLVNDREEIDYLIKSFARVREQLRFDIFSSKVACKILDEAQFLYGNPAVFKKVKELVEESGTPAQLRSLEQQAKQEREMAESQLLEMDPEKEGSEYLNLFYTRAEEDEIY